MKVGIFKQPCRHGYQYLDSDLRILWYFFVAIKYFNNNKDILLQQNSIIKKVLLQFSIATDFIVKVGNEIFSLQ